MIYNPKEFKLEKTTIWSFEERGKWATHRGDYRGNCPPQVPRNLILKYTKENDFIAININQKDNVYTEIFIIDSGVGIKQEDIPYIFDRFFRSENVRDKDIEGSGIGLSIAKMIAINLGAEISVKCENNKTEFKIIIQNNKCDKIT